MKKRLLKPCMLIVIAVTVISICNNIAVLLGYASPSYLPLSDVLMLIATPATLILATLAIGTRKRLDNKSRNRLRQKPAGRDSRLTAGLLKLILDSEDEQESIVGDLLEEFCEFDSRLNAYLWL